MRRASFVVVAVLAWSCQRPGGNLEGADGGPGAPACGDGHLDPGEVCDDGNTSSGDHCSADCQSDETCGNGVVDRAAGELCDDGNTLGGDNCSADCKSDETCGNGVVDVDRGETCDDGNTTSGDMCSPNCQSNESCGNGVVDADKGEECDEHNQATKTCDPDCTFAKCGDGTINHAAGEDCDDHNTSDNDSCTHLCKVSRCGDGIRNAMTEECDDGNTDNNDGCRNDCKNGPGNDVASGAVDISAGGTFTVNLAQAHDDIRSSCNELGGKDAFYQFTLAHDETVYADTFGSTFDTTLAVYSGPCTARTGEVDCEDDACDGNLTQIAGPLDAGTYCLVLDQNSPASPAGAATLTFRQTGRAYGQEIDLGSNVALPGNTTAGNDNQMHPSCGDNGSAPDDGYYFLLCPGETLHLDANTCMTESYDAVLYVRAAASSGVDRACNDDDPASCGGSHLTADLSGSADLYWLVIDGNGGSGGAYTLTYTLSD